MRSRTLVTATQKTDQKARCRPHVAFSWKMRIAVRVSRSQRPLRRSSVLFEPLESERVRTHRLVDHWLRDL